jgi:hypothetical protein
MVGLDMRVAVGVAVAVGVEVGVEVEVTVEVAVTLSRARITPHPQSLFRLSSRRADAAPTCYEISRFGLAGPEARPYPARRLAGP